MLRRAARRRAKDEPADGHSPATRPCTALRTLHSTAGPAQHCTALRTLSLCYEQRGLLSPTLPLSRPRFFAGLCLSAGSASRPPCLSAGSPLARLCLSSCSCLSARLVSLQGSLFAASAVPVVRGRVQCARACFASFPPLPPARLCLSARLVASLQGSLSAAFCGLPRCFEAVCSAHGHVFASRACSSRSFSVSLWL